MSLDIALKSRVNPGRRLELRRDQKNGVNLVDRIAIKRLTDSDCTLFEGVFRKTRVGNQKSINLNADVLTGEIYPNLASVAAMTENQIALAIAIYGPGAKGAHNLSRKIIKNTTYKNWRLNGEFVPGPPGDTNRYDSIGAGDLAVMIFRGDAVPTGMDMILVSQSDPADAPLHGALGLLFRNRSMIAVTPAEISTAVATAGVPDTHPVLLAAADPKMDAAIEDAAQGGFEGMRSLRQNKGGRKISAADFAKAKAEAELTGQNGEGLVNGYLTAKVAAGEFAGFKWVSAENAIAPYDFYTVTVSGQRTLIDAKATAGAFENVIHLSLAEIIEASGTTPYRIYRVFGLSEDGGRLRVSGEIGMLAKQLRAIHDAHMPAGVRVDGFSISTSSLTWGAEEYVERQEE